MPYAFHLRLGGVRWPILVYCVIGAICGSDVRIHYGIDTTLLLNVMVCDLYFDSHILLCFCITLILILYVIGIKCVYVREYYEYSLTVNKSLLLLLL